MIESHRFWVVCLVIVFALAPIGLLAHEGPVDREGCHYDWQGKRHCH